MKITLIAMGLLFIIPGCALIPSMAPRTTYYERADAFRIDEQYQIVRHRKLRDVHDPIGCWTRTDTLAADFDLKDSNIDGPVYHWKYSTEIVPLVHKDTDHAFLIVFENEKITDMYTFDTGSHTVAKVTGALDRNHQQVRLYSLRRLGLDLLAKHKKFLDDEEKPQGAMQKYAAQAGDGAIEGLVSLLDQPAHYSAYYAPYPDYTLRAAEVLAYLQAPAGDVVSRALKLISGEKHIDFLAQEDVFRVIGRYGSESVPYLVRILQTEPGIVFSCLSYLDRHDPGVIRNGQDALLAYYHDKAHPVQSRRSALRYACKAMKGEDGRSLELLKHALNDPDMRRDAADLIGEYAEDDATVNALILERITAGEKDREFLTSLMGSSCFRSGTYDITGKSNRAYLRNYKKMLDLLSGDPYIRSHPHWSEQLDDHVNVQYRALERTAAKMRYDSFGDDLRKATDELVSIFLRQDAGVDTSQ